MRETLPTTPSSLRPGWSRDLTGKTNRAKTPRLRQSVLTLICTGALRWAKLMVSAVPLTGQSDFSYTVMRRSAPADVGAVLTKIDGRREPSEHLRTGGRVVKGNRL